MKGVGSPSRSPSKPSKRYQRKTKRERQEEATPMTTLSPVRDLFEVNWGNCLSPTPSVAQPSYLVLHHGHRQYALCPIRVTSANKDLATAGFKLPHAFASPQNRFSLKLMTVLVKDIEYESERSRSQIPSEYGPGRLWVPPKKTVDTVSVQGWLLTDRNSWNTLLYS